MYVAWRAREASARSSEVLLGVFAKLLGRKEAGAASSIAAE